MGGAHGKGGRLRGDRVIPGQATGRILRVVLACDGSYAMPLATVLRSVVEANRSGAVLEFCVLCDGFSTGARQRVCRSMPEEGVVLRWVEMDLRPFTKFSTICHISTATYGRLLIGGLLPKEVSRAIYLDADLLVLQDLSPLWDLDLKGAVLAAVRDERLAAKLNRSGSADIELPKVKDYFCAAVLVIDLRRWRTDRIGERAIRYLEEHPDTPYSDQDALNFACDGKWLNIEHRWNSYQVDVQKPVAQLPPADRPAIIHFHGRYKPWLAGSLSPHAELYNSFRKRTQFARTPAEQWGHFVIAICRRAKRQLKTLLGLTHLGQLVRGGGPRTPSVMTDRRVGHRSAATTNDSALRSSD